MLQQIKACVSGEQKAILAGGVGAILGLGAGLGATSLGGVLSG